MSPERFEFERSTNSLIASITPVLDSFEQEDFL